MPPMPVGDPWPGIDTLLKAERQIRTGGGIDDVNHWADLVRLLQVHR
jgi:thymidylate synthase